MKKIKNLPIVPLFIIATIFIVGLVTERSTIPAAPPDMREIVSQLRENFDLSEINPRAITSILHMTDLDIYALESFLQSSADIDDELASFIIQKLRHPELVSE